MGHRGSIMCQNLVCFGKFRTVLMGGQWVNISNGLKLAAFQLQMVPGNSWTICRCLGSSTKNWTPVTDIELFSQNRLIFWSNATVLAGGQQVNFSDAVKLCSNQLRLVSGKSWAISKCLWPITKNWTPVTDMRFFLKMAPILVQMPRYWLRVKGWLFRMDSNYVPTNSGWSQVTPEQFASV